MILKEMQSLHLDYWSADATNARVFLISTGVEVSYTVILLQLDNGIQ